MSTTIIKVTNLSKEYEIGNKSEKLSETIGNFFKPRKKQVNKFWALKNISFDIKKGEVVGIIGRNGAGKSTLLKILSRITEPTQGRAEIEGKTVSLLEVGTGFHPELSGRENIYLNGTILGMKRREINEKFKKIVDFSGVEPFIDTPVKHYSSGMYVRLAFAVAANLESEVLIIDEVLSVGDEDFQKKCLGKIDKISKSGRTVLFVSHNIQAVRKLCTKVILLENGKIKEIGKVNDVIASYYKVNELLNLNQKTFLSKTVDYIQLYNSKQKKVSKIKFGEPFFIKIQIHLPIEVDGVFPDIIIKNNSGLQILTSRASDINYFVKNRTTSPIKISAFYENLFLVPGIYYLSFRLKERGGHMLEKLWDIFTFQIEQEPFSKKVVFTGGFGVIANQPEWKFSQ